MLSLRLSGYLILLIIPIVFLHNRNLQKDYEVKGAGEMADEILRTPINDGVGNIDIQPDISGQ